MKKIKIFLSLALLIAIQTFAQVNRTTLNNLWKNRIVPPVADINTTWASMYNKVNEPSIGTGSIVMSGAGYNSTHQIYTMGDSFMAAAVIQPSLSAALNNSFAIVNYGIPGNTTTQMANRFTGVTAGRPEYVIILGGINDIVGSVPASSIIANIQSMCTAAQAAGSKVILLTTTPFKNNVGWSAATQSIQTTLNTAILSTTAITNVDFRVDIYTPLESPAQTLNALFDSGDGLHPNAAGYNLIANVIYTTVSTWSVSPTIPILYISRTFSITQDLTPLSTAAFNGLNITGAINTFSNPINSGSITSSGNISGTSILASNNSTFTGIVYGLNSFQVGALGVNGSIGAGGGGLKMIAGSTTPDIILGNNANANGRLAIKNTGNIVIGDIAAVSDNSTHAVQIYSNTITQSLDITHTAPFLNLNTTSATNAIINFRNAAGTNTYLSISADISTGECRYFARSGGYFPTFYSNGSERMRIIATGQVGIGVTAPTAFLHLKAGTTTSVTAPLKFTIASSSVMTTPEAGAMETNTAGVLFYTPVATRYQVATCLTNTATIDFPNTAAGAVSDMTITVTGVVDGDACIVGMTNATVPAAGCYVSWGSATNVATIRFVNNSLGSAYDPPSGVFKVTAIKN